jgi:hypothetical protein
MVYRMFTYVRKITIPDNFVNRKTILYQMPPLPKTGFTESPKPSQKSSLTSFALPLTICKAPSEQALTQLPQPSQSSSLIVIIFLFILILLILPLSLRAGGVTILIFLDYFVIPNLIRIPRNDIPKIFFTEQHCVLQFQDSLRRKKCP